MENGATPISHTGVLEELKRYETGYYGGKPGRWEGEANSRADVKASRFKPPSVLFPRELFFDDGKRRVELVHLGVALEGPPAAEHLVEDQTKSKDVAAMSTGDRIRCGSWMSGLKTVSRPASRAYDLSLDSRRFLMVKWDPRKPTPVTELILVQNWFEELQRLVPTGKN